MTPPDSRPRTPGLLDAMRLVPPNVLGESGRQAPLMVTREEDPLRSRSCARLQPAPSGADGRGFANTMSQPIDRVGHSKTFARLPRTVPEAAPKRHATPSVTVTLGESMISTV